MPYPPRSAEGEPIIDWAREVNGTADCPHGWRSAGKVGAISWEDSRVNIYAGICDRPDRCGITTCQYYDNSPKATRFHVAASVYFNHSLEGQILRRSWQDKGS